MMVNNVNGVSFGASLQTALRTPEAKMFMQAGKRFQKLTAKNYPNDKLVLKEDFIDSGFPILTLGDCNQFITNISNDFVKFNLAKNEKELVSKLVKTFKILVENREMLIKLNALDPNSEEYSKAAMKSIEKMKRIAGEDSGLKGFIGAMQIGMDL